jgi:phosphoribosylamine--glycine ligase
MVFEKAIDGRLDEAEIVWDRRTALGVVLAAHGYPDDPRKGDPIDGLPTRGNPPDSDCLVFHAGTIAQDGRTLTSGGRVLCVTALGDSVKIAQSRAYQGIDAIRFDGMQCRRDIGHRAIARNR